MYTYSTFGCLSAFLKFVELFTLCSNFCKEFSSFSCIVMDIRTYICLIRIQHALYYLQQYNCIIQKLIDIQVHKIPVCRHSSEDTHTGSVENIIIVWIIVACTGWRRECTLFFLLFSPKGSSLGLPPLGKYVELLCTTCTLYCPLSLTHHLTRMYPALQFHFPVSHFPFPVPTF